MYEIAICDDGPRSVDDLRTLLGDVLDERGVAHHVSLYASPGELLRALEGGALRCFVRPQRSYLVNLEHVSAISRAQITLSSGDAVPISKNLYRKVQTSLVEYDDHRS